MPTPDAWMGESLVRLMSPQSIAILGCSAENAGGVTLRNLLDNDYPGAIYPVHPRHEQVLGRTAYRTVSEIPATVDCAVIALRADLVPAALDELHAAGVRAAVIFASGFSELGDSGHALQAQVRSKLDAYRIAACGPNCLGVLSFESKAAMYYAGLDMADRRGPIGFVSHSGSSCIAVTNSGRGPGFSYVVSCGNEAGASVADYVRFLADDPSTTVIALHLEAVRDAAGLGAAARYAATHGKPVVVLKTGRSEIGQRTAAAHSGALASPHELTSAFFRRHGMVLVDDLDELLETCEILAGLRHKAPGTGAVAVTAVSGGMAGLSADVGSETGLEFAVLGHKTMATISETLSSHSTPGNPLDVTLALHDTGAYERCLEVLDADPEVGLIAVCQGAEPDLNEQQRLLYAPIAHMIARFAATSAKPVVCFSPVSGGLEPTFAALLRDAGVPLLMGVRSSLLAIRRALWWHSHRDSVLADAPEESDLAAQTAPVPGLSGPLSERDGKALLARYGVEAPGEELVTDSDAAVAAASRIGLPVVMKVDTPDIAHKTEAGVVRVGVQSLEDVAGAFEELLANARAYAPDARLNGISVQEYVEGGFEMVLGIKNDPTFGPAVIVGAGGIYTEVLADVSMELAPVTKAAAEQMIAGLRCYPILQGIRGQEPRDLAALRDAVVSLGELAWENRSRIAELDVNPLVVLPEGRGVRALDALVIPI